MISEPPAITAISQTGNELGEGGVRGDTTQAKEGLVQFAVQYVLVPFAATHPELQLLALSAYAPVPDKHVEQFGLQTNYY